MGVRVCIYLGLCLAMPLTATSTGKETRTVLVFTSGGFTEHQPIRYAVTALRNAGFKPVVAKYPLHNLPAAVSYARKLARDNPNSGALGFSAGGVLVADLAARDLVRKAVAVGAITDLKRWDVNPSFYGYGDGATSQWQLVPATMRERWRASPTRLFQKLGRHRKLLVIHSRDDGMVPFDQAQELAQRSGGQLMEAKGAHGSYFKSSVPAAIQWLRTTSPQTRQSR